ncbi:hypothetical protein CYMTET_9726 [Cymbomonas tetramitiformis]|uniref:K Homology domain-containing protein n=1 Tax=Cymbomonas tetramitiformis TaxID=36881 RepID=A0AAE0LEU9_9CHLO|nr:hypothetical protein CYMTET_9726 [Cymbomonas tetramitiformis]|eukprot:gene10214-12086_t
MSNFDVGSKRSFDDCNQRSSSTLTIHREHIPLVVGPRGATVKQLESNHGVRIATPRRDEDRRAETVITITGDSEAVLQTKLEVLDILRNHTDDRAIDNIEIPIRSDAISRVVGKRGAVINQIQERSHARLSIPRDSSRDSGEVRCQVSGDKYAIDMAALMIEDCLSRDQDRDHYPRERPRSHSSFSPSLNTSLSSSMVPSLSSNPTKVQAFPNPETMSNSQVMMELLASQEYARALEIQQAALMQNLQELANINAAQQKAAAHSVFVPQSTTMGASGGGYGGGGSAYSGVSGGGSSGGGGFNRGGSDIGGGYGGGHGGGYGLTRGGSSRRSSGRPSGSDKEHLQLLIPAEHVHHLIGRKGTIVKQLEEDSGTTIGIPRSEEDGGGPNKVVTVSRGSLPALARAARMICQRILEGTEEQSPPAMKILVPAEQIPRVVGKRGVTVQRIQDETGVMVSTPRRGQSESPDGASEAVTVSGDLSSLEIAAAMILECLDDIGNRDS